PQPREHCVCLVVVLEAHREHVVLVDVSGTHSPYLSLDRVEGWRVWSEALRERSAIVARSRLSYEASTSAAASSPAHTTMSSGARVTRSVSPTARSSGSAVRNSSSSRSSSATMSSYV